MLINSHDTSVESGRDVTVGVQYSRLSRASAWRVGLAVLVLMQATAGALLAQGPQDYIVRFRAGTSAAARASVVRSAGATLDFNFNRVNAAAVRVPNANALAALQNNASVLAMIPNRPVFASQHAKGKPGTGGGTAAQEIVPAGVIRVGVPTATSNGSGVGVAVLDTGVDLAHPDLTGTVDAFNAFGGVSCQDDAGHGTHVAGTIAARDNEIDVIGVAPFAQIYCVKVLDAAGGGSDATVMAGLEWVLANQASIRVVNMSLGRPGTVDDNPDLHNLITSVHDAGIAIVVSAGNDASFEVGAQIPAGYPGVISVASTTAQSGANQCRSLASPIAADTASYFTTDGIGVTVSAPGEDREDVSRSCLITSVGILSTQLGGGTTRMSGTSMAAPHVAGIAARYYQQNPAYTAEDIRQFLSNGAARVGGVPLGSPTGTYTFDGELEGIAQAP
jgi:subtilisin